MEFLDNLPGKPTLIDSSTIVRELEDNPGKWGKFYVQGEETDKTARGRVNILRLYVERKELPIEVRGQKDKESGRITGYARWNKSL